MCERLIREQHDCSTDWTVTVERHPQITPISAPENTPLFASSVHNVRSPSSDESEGCQGSSIIGATRDAGGALPNFGMSASRACHLPSAKCRFEVSYYRLLCSTAAIETITGRHIPLWHED